MARWLIETDSGLDDSYDELCLKTFSDRYLLALFFRSLMHVATNWNLASTIKARGNRERLRETVARIAEGAADLANLFRLHDDLRERSGFRTDLEYHVVDHIDAAMSGNAHYEYFMKEQLLALRLQYDLKYWPSMGQVLDAVAADAEDVSVDPKDELARAATSSRRPSKADFVKRLLADVEELKGINELPLSFKLTDETVASFVNCALDLDAKDIVDGAYVKRLRQRERDRMRNDEGR